MPLLKDGRILADKWIAVADDAPLPLQGPVLVSLARWTADRDEILACDAPVGIRLRSDEPPTLIEADVHRFALIALEFPAFTDGRAYSYARVLRERFGFGGELRAVGNVLRDQLLFMARCGFDAFEADLRGGPAAWEAAVREVDVWYQPTGDGRRSVLSHRHGAAYHEPAPASVRSVRAPEAAE